MSERSFRLTLVLGLTIGTLFVTATGVATAAGRDPALQTYLSANGLLNRGLYELSAAEYRKFLEGSPVHEKAGVARYGLGVSLYRMERFDQVIEALTPLY